MPHPSPVQYFSAYRFDVTIDGEPLNAWAANVEDRGQVRVITIRCALQQDENGFPASRLSIYEDGEHTVVVSMPVPNKMLPSDLVVEWCSSRARAESFSPCSFDTQVHGPVFEQIVFVGKRG